MIGEKKREKENNPTEREELHRSIWNIANKLRGSIDGWDFKQYILGIIFYRYISENLASYVNENEHKAGDKQFNYAESSDEDITEQIKNEIIDVKGFFISPSNLFSNVKNNASNDPNLNETLWNVFKNIENSTKGTKSEKNFIGLFDDIDTNSKKLGSTITERNKKLTKILNSVGEMNFNSCLDSSIDVFGDAYEYLIQMYASDASKLGGEFFTPHGVSQLLIKLTTINKKTINKIYDPACGTGSLLLQAIKIFNNKEVKEFYGQEINITSYNLCRINMFLHNIHYENFHIVLGDTLVNPGFKETKFDVIVSHLPYSKTKWEGDTNPVLINDERFSRAGVLAPKSKTDFAFIMHSLWYLAPNGIAAIVCVPGIMYCGGAEQKIRKYLVDNNFIDCIIQLPKNLFGTLISTCILILNKAKSDKDILFIDASNEFIKITNANNLSTKNIETIVDAYKTRTNKKDFAKLVSYIDVAKNDYNLEVSTYILKEQKTNKINIRELNLQLEELVKKENDLRNQIDKIIRELEVQ